MRSKLLILTLVSMILFIGCGNKVDKVPEQEKTEDPIQEEIEIEEESTDVESTEEESEWEILLNGQSQIMKPS